MKNLSRPFIATIASLVALLTSTGLWAQNSSPSSPFHSIDLSRHKNAIPEEMTGPFPGFTMPKGRVTLQGVPYQVDGLVRLFGRGLAQRGEKHPDKALNIPVGKRGKVLHLLFQTVEADAPGAPVLDVILHPKEGKPAAFRIKYGDHLLPCFAFSGQESEPLKDPNARLAWNGTSRDPAAASVFIRLYEVRLPVPFETEIKSLDLLSLYPVTAPTLYAITLRENDDPGLSGREAYLVPADAYKEFRQSLSVKIVQSAGKKAVAGVTIKGNARGENTSFSLLDGVTDKAGLAVIEFPRNTLSLILQTVHPGFTPVTQIIRKSDDQFPASAQITMDPGQKVGGVVKGRDGKPVAKASVKIIGSLQDDVGQVVESELAIVETDAQGKWSSSSVSKDFEYLTLIISHPEYKPLEAYLTPDADSQINRKDLVAGKALLTIDAARRISGSVVGPGRKPLSGATVFLGREGEENGSITLATDANGRYQTHLFDEAQYEIAAVAPAHAPELKKLSRTDGDETVDFELKPGAKIHGLVLDENEQPLEGAQISLEHWNQLKILKWSTETDENGRFSWDGAPESGAVFAVTRPGVMALTNRTFLPDQENRIRLQRTFQLIAKVLDAQTGEPVPSFRIIPGRIFNFAADSQVQWEDHYGKNGANGETSIGVPQHYDRNFKARFAVEAEGYLPVASPPYSVEGWHEYEFKLEKGSGPKGIVLDSSGNPIADVQVALLTHEYLSLAGKELKGVNKNISKTGPDGKFQLNPKLFPGAIVAVHSTGFAEISPEEFSDHITLQLQPWGRVEGKIQVSGKPLPEAEMMAMHGTFVAGVPSLQYDWETFRVNSDEEGRFVFENVPPGNRAVTRLIPSGNRSWRHANTTPVRVTPGTTSTLLIGEKGKRIVGKMVSDATEEVHWSNGYNSFSTEMAFPRFSSPEENREFMKSKEYQDFLSRRKDYPVEFSSDGSFVIHDVQPGAYTLRIHVMEPGSRRFMGSFNQNVEVPEGNLDEPIDLGELKLSLQTPRSPGNQAGAGIKSILEALAETLKKTGSAKK